MNEKRKRLLWDYHVSILSISAFVRFHLSNNSFLNQNFLQSYSLFGFCSNCWEYRGAYSSSSSSSSFFLCPFSMLHGLDYSRCNFISPLVPIPCVPDVQAVFPQVTPHCLTPRLGRSAPEGGATRIYFEGLNPSQPVRFILPGHMSKPAEPATGHQNCDWGDAKFGSKTVTRRVVTNWGAAHPADHGWFSSIQPLDVLRFSRPGLTAIE